MRVVSKIISAMLFCPIILTSCGGVTALPTVKPTLIATLAIPPTRTLLPTFTNIPEPSATATYSPAEKIFTIPIMQQGLVDTPTPIATPSLSKSSMRLKDFSEQDALSLIQKMNEYSYRNYPPLLDWWTESNFVASQKPIAIAIQEYLYRFPESSNSERLHWQLAYIHSITYTGLSGNQYGDQWIITELQKKLNQGEVRPDQLEKILGPYWFDVTYFQAIKNLFNDGKTGWFYQIASRYSYGGGLFIAIRELKDKQFQIFLLNSAWNFVNGESSVYKIEDHNKNGVPEIALYIGAHSGTICGGKLLVYEWQIDSFAELTNDQISLNDCGEDIEYSIVDGSPAIVHSGLFPKRTEIYDWNGKFYKFLRYTDMTLFETWQYSQGTTTNSSYANEAEILREVLASGEIKKYGSTYVDFLRYRLGVVYAFQSQRDKAFSEFQDLVSNPMDKTRNIFPNMAKKFMAVYTGDESIYDACHQAYKIYDKALALSAGTNGYIDKEVQKVLGITFDNYSMFSIIPCDEQNAFAFMVNSIPVTVEDLNAELHQDGVDVIYSRKLDVNLDGKAEEWIIAFDDNGLFLIYPDGSNYQAEKLPAYTEINKTNNVSTQIAVDRWRNFPDPVVTIQSGQYFTLLDVDENFNIKSLLDDFGVMNYVVSNRDTVPQFQFFYMKPRNSYYPDHPWGGYRWDQTTNTFTNDLLEYDLFILHNPEKSAEIVDKLFPLLEKWKTIPGAATWSLAYSYYISGLSYELSGDRQKAAQIYWQLWHDFPESPYALMARYKLELVKP